MAMDIPVQRLQVGDVILAAHPEHGGEVEASVRAVERTVSAMLATLRVAGIDDFGAEWPLGELVTVVRGP